MSRAILDKVLKSVVDHDDYFRQKTSCDGKTGIATWVKVTAALCILAYIPLPDAMDEYLAMSELTAEVKMKRFCSAVVGTFGLTYLRALNNDDIKQSLQDAKRDGTPGLFESIDCSKWNWKRCSTAGHEKFKGKEKKATVKLEAIADRSLWIWHVFICKPKCLNEINVVEASELLWKTERRVPITMRVLSCRYPAKQTVLICRPDLLEGIHVHIVDTAADSEKKESIREAAEISARRSWARLWRAVGQVKDYHIPIELHEHGYNADDHDGRHRFS